MFYIKKVNEYRSKSHVILAFITFLICFIARLVWELTLFSLSYHHKISESPLNSYQVSGWRRNEPDAKSFPGTSSWTAQVFVFGRCVTLTGEAKDEIKIQHEPTSSYFCSMDGLSGSCFIVYIDTHEAIDVLINV